PSNQKVRFPSVCPENPKSVRKTIPFLLKACIAADVAPLVERFWNVPARGDCCQRIFQIAPVAFSCVRAWPPWHISAGWRPGWYKFSGRLYRGRKPIRWVFDILFYGGYVIIFAGFPV